MKMMLLVFAVALVFFPGVSHAQDRESETLARPVALGILRDELPRLVLSEWEVRIPASLTAPTVPAYRTREEAPGSLPFDPARLDDLVPSARALVRFYGELASAGVLLSDGRPTGVLMPLGRGEAGPYRYAHVLRFLPRPDMPDMWLEGGPGRAEIVVRATTPQVIQVTGIAQDGPRATVEAEVGAVGGALARAFEYFFFTANRSIILERLRGPQVPAVLQNVMQAAAAAEAPRILVFQMQHYDDGWRLVR